MTYNPFSLKNKTILVTGASSGIGQSTAIECSKMGARLVIVGRNSERLNETFSQLEHRDLEHVRIVADLTQEIEVKKILSTIDSIDGLVLCAGKGMTLPFPFCTRDKFDDIFEINFFSPIELLRLLIKKKKIVKGGSVVFVSSIGGVERFSPANSIYGSSKAAIDSMVKFCALELSNKNIRVNSVNPGMVNTKLIQSGTLSDEQLQKDMQVYPLKRYGEPEDVAFGIIYLLSSAASWITGHSLVIDGGITIK